MTLSTTTTAIMTITVIMTITGIDIRIDHSMTTRLQPRHSIPGAALQRRNADVAGYNDVPSALAGERIRFDGIGCYVAGSGPPLILVHSINAVSSAAEMRPLYDRYRATRTVYAIDLPGFGCSDRSNRAYTPRVMTDALHTLADRVSQIHGSVPIDAVASSLGCEFLARAAVERPQQWGRLALVSPTGLEGHTPRRGRPGSTRAKTWLHALLIGKPWSAMLYRGLTRPAVIRYFLQRTWGSPSIDEALWKYDVRTARQPGARFAPLYFLAGHLFSQDIHRIYESLSQSVWMSHGVRGDFTDFRAKALIHDSGNWRTSVFQSGALPYFEMPIAFCAALEEFWSGASFHHHRW
jgi:pimeloyl-ACP methyl ester carboxylesterase